jgi:hypothetical protein
VPYDPTISIGYSRSFLWLSRAAASILPVGVAAAWIPLRTHLPNTAAALFIALAVGVAATATGRVGALFGSATGTLAFDLFDTAPYGQLLITSLRDVVTAAALAVSGLLVGEVCVRLKAYRLMADRRVEDFAVMSAAAGLMALGEDAAVVVRALAGELQRLLDLEDCEFEFGPLTGIRPYVSRDATLMAAGSMSSRPVAAGTTEADLPVWLNGQVVGYYRMAFSGLVPSRDRLAAAVGLAEQSGAALAGSKPDRRRGPSGRRGLHVVR